MKINATSIKKLFSISILAVFLMASFSCCSSPANTAPSKTLDDYPVIEIPASDVQEITTTVSSVQMAKNMIIGWNLGNTLDATGDWTEGNVFHSDLKGLETETGWGMPETTEAMITAVKAAGFKTIRIPVSWHNHITDKSNYKIDPKWMARVKTVVDWAYNKDMYVIINIHHDNLKESQLAGNCGFALSYDADLQNQSKAYIRNVWTQIAIEFASYGERLVFEVLNEPRDVGGEVTGNEWWTTNRDIVSVITDYEQIAINSIRNVKGNKNRFIMVPGYAASGSAKAILDLYTMPTDTATDRLILSTHAYSPNDFALSENGKTTFDDKGKSDLDYIFGFLKSDYVSKGIGVVMGEASSTDRNNTAAREAWTTYYFTKAKAAGIPVVLWDNMVTVSYKGHLGSGENHGYYNRNNNTWFFPSIIEAMMKAVYGDNYTAE